MRRPCEGRHTQRQTETEKRDRRRDTDRHTERQANKHTQFCCDPRMLYSCASSVMVESQTKTIKLKLGLVWSSVPFISVSDGICVLRKADNVRSPSRLPDVFPAFEDVLLVEFMHLVNIRMPGESYRRRLRSLLLWFLLVVLCLLYCSLNLMCVFLCVCFLLARHDHNKIAPCGMIFFF